MAVNYNVIVDKLKQANLKAKEIIQFAIHLSIAQKLIQEYKRLKNLAEHLNLGFLWKINHHYLQDKEVEEIINTAGKILDSLLVEC